ncbi:cytochrome P450 family protein [Lapillicoccus jejuensis]|uniref:Cytochrome P450 n=1 Tax=Lapillicoccus jejuensis TaxID=402171 RepID=A0A542E5J0_9MICO|nr:cytochrome P450 [Lapillicoccus jejuensis]TQJ10556.1 cytochrome P450 [Lapillicoccus jejuensis]
MSSAAPTLPASSSEPLRLGDAFVQDPHSVYARLRDEAPVQRVALPSGLEAWLVTRYDDVRAGLADPRLAKDFRRLRAAAGIRPGTGRPLAQDSLSSHMLSADPPDHRRLRTLVNQAFTPRTVERLRPRVEQIAAGLLDALPGHADEDGVVDLLEHYALPLPITVICELLGVPEADRDDVRRWSDDLLSPEDVEAVPQSAGEFAAYLGALVATKRSDPGDDLLSGLATATLGGSGDGDDRLSEDEQVGMAFLLVVAGHETTVNLVGTGALALLRRPELAERVRADEASRGAVVEELLRHDGPVNGATLRFTTEEVEIAGVRLPAGEIVLLSLGSADCDPRRFADPAKVDLERGGAGHLAFGHGIHFCLGAPLARLEGVVALGRLLERYPGITLAAGPDDLRWRRSVLLRGLRELPVRLG